MVGREDREVVEGSKGVVTSLYTNIKNIYKYILCSYKKSLNIILPNNI